jgi:spore cortex formation protein SpoVR/YcgB (stage V sporulation)
MGRYGSDDDNDYGMMIRKDEREVIQLTKASFHNRVHTTNIMSEKCAAYDHSHVLTPFINSQYW